MEIKVIQTKKEYEAALEWVDQLFDKKVGIKSPEGEKLQVAIGSIKQYEDTRLPIPNPVDAIRTT
jgi:HTH-type transcriptional regulator/antitoxin HigA